MGYTLIIGLGGAGGRVTAEIAKRMHENENMRDTEKIRCAVLDTDEGDMNNYLYRSGVPAITISRDLAIKDLLKLHEHRGVADWFPNERKAVLERNLINGTNGSRLMGRLAFLDAATNEMLAKLEQEIYKMLELRDDPHIKVMLVTSLAGGTGSGILIQCALWIRRFLRQRNYSCRIYGYFLLPDVFVQTFPGLRNSRREISALYANCYATIRELNEIDKVNFRDKTSVGRITLDGLFDSDKPSHAPIFDGAYFYDAVDGMGRSLDSFEAYIWLAAQTLYAQAIFPTTGLRPFQCVGLGFAEPHYGSAVAAITVYPREDILEYCTLRAMQDSIKQVWGKIDAEIHAEIETRKKQEETSFRIDPRERYITLFEEKVESDPLFQSMRHDMHNESFEQIDGENHVQYTDKIADLFEIIHGFIQNKIDMEEGVDPLICKDLPKMPDDKKVKTFSPDFIKAHVNVHEARVREQICVFEEDAERIAEDIADTILPHDMGCTNWGNGPLLGLFAKCGPDKTIRYVHPIAARYLVYMLDKRIGEQLDSLTPEMDRDRIENLEFSDGKTVSECLADLTDRCFLRKHRTLEFLRSYAEYNHRRQELYRIYEYNLLKKYVLKNIISQLYRLIGTVEDFFQRITKQAQDDILRLIEWNVQKNEQPLQNTLFLHASGKDKGAKYGSLNLDLAESIEGLNKVLIKEVYGSFCADFHPFYMENSVYKERSSIRVFLDNLRDGYKKLLEKKHGYAFFESIDCAIIDGCTGNFECEAAVDACMLNVKLMASPLMQFDADDSNLTILPTFWGIHPRAEHIRSLFGKQNFSNVIMNSAFSPNEICCYRAKYGVRVSDISGFKNNGKYYKAYKKIVSEMVQKNSRMITPHIDKTWHEILPQLSSEEDEPQ